jgi:multisubunit Na+/H+ antiporter MnhB subunit
MSPRASRVWLLLPVTVFVVIALTVGLVATGTIREPYATPFFHLFFRDVLQMKAWLVTAAVVLACGQLVTAARIYELLRFPPKRRLYIAGRGGRPSC